MRKSCYLCCFKKLFQLFSSFYLHSFTLFPCSLLLLCYVCCFPCPSVKSQVTDIINFCVFVLSHGSHISWLYVFCLYDFSQVLFYGAHCCKAVKMLLWQANTEYTHRETGDGVNNHSLGVNE